MLKTVGLFCLTMSLTFLTAPAAWAQSSKGATPRPDGLVAEGVSRQTLGDLTIYSLADGQGRLDFSIILGLNKEGIRSLVGQSPEMDDHSLASYTNCFLVKSPAGLFLVDTGKGDGANLAQRVRAAGFAPEEVTDVLLTHFHGDHINGLLAGDKALFPKATVWAAASEDRYWLQEGATTRGQAAEARISPYRQAGRYKTFQPGDAIKPGVTSVGLSGHTPGHVGFLFQSGAGELLLWGDIVHAYLVQFARPATSVTYDVDPTAAAATRAQIMKKSAEAGYLVGGAHLPFPGLGQIQAKAEAYEWVKTR
ncbi:MAG: MBL fold metallo-hydrolase [Deltaproteobacteria bacterium]|jgi:glyoxylase-like metal-dependent hydrolase (beta-lactamase superfamily II)|nr:MBL fold metallo-hydrolase [Deltaproteobacteria bacterium]